MNESKGIIFVRYSCGTNTARFCGKTASSTSDPMNAAYKVASKVLGDDRYYELRMLGNQYAYEVWAEGGSR